MRVKVISRSADEFTRERSNDLQRVSRNYDPNFRTQEKAVEYVRALNAAKLDKVFARPFIGAMDGHIDAISCMAKNPNHLKGLFSGSMDGADVSKDDKSLMERQKLQIICYKLVNEEGSTFRKPMESRAFGSDVRGLTGIPVGRGCFLDVYPVRFDLTTMPSWRRYSSMGYCFKTMIHHKHHTRGIQWVLVLLSLSIGSHSWFFSSGKIDSIEKPSEYPETSSNLVVAEFSMEPFNSKKGTTLLEKAKEKAAWPNSCWQNAYQNLFAGCSKILAGEEQRSRLAWHLTDCFQKDIGKSPFPYCDVKSRMVDCLKRVDREAHNQYLEFYLETNTICHQLQTDAFKRQTERLVNELKRSAESAEDKLENIEEQADRLLHSSDNVHSSLSSIDVQTQELAQTSKNVEERVSVVLMNSQSIYEQSLKIADSQLELGSRQKSMNEKVDEGMAMLNESANRLGEEMNRLKNEAAEIEKEIGKVRDAMFVKMGNLQNKADDIDSKAETSLVRQKQLLEHQTTAFEVLQTLISFQHQAIEESRATVQQMMQLGPSHQHELIQKQEQLKKSHDHLFENSQTILAAQETFESKQASMFLAIDKLFILHNAILVESRGIKVFLIYSVLIFILYMFTSPKQTYSVRSRLYIGLCLTLLIEFLVLRYGNDVEQQTWIISIVRLVSALLAACQLLYAIYTYRDYETLNHEMLQSLIEKVNGIQNKQLSYDDGDDDVDVNWSKWVDSDITDDELEGLRQDHSQDPDYMLP